MEDDGSALKDMRGMVCLITGANSGIGKATAKELARLGARVGMVCRDEARGREAQAEIQSVAEDVQARSPAAIRLHVADLSAQHDVRRLAEQIQAEYDRLDVLVNNAGVFLERREETVDGIEMTFAVNYLAPFLLTHLLLPLLEETAERAGEARVVNLSSEAHRGSRIDFDDINAEANYNPLQAYGQSQLATILFTHELAQRVGETGVLVNAVHPGMVATNIWRGSGWISRVGRLFSWLYKRPEEAAESVVHLAASPEVAGVTGQYFKETEVVNPSPEAYDEKTEARLWRLSQEMTGLAGPLPANEEGLP